MGADKYPDMSSIQPNDLYSPAGAARLAKRIVRYWRDRGFHGITAEPYKLGSNFTSIATGDWYGVRSNIGPFGYPPRLPR